MTTLADRLLDSLHTAIAVVGPDGTLNYRNEAFNGAFGERAELWMREGGRAVGGAPGWLQSLFAGATATDVELDGRVWHVERLSTDSTAEGQLALTFQDVTAQRNAEQAKSDFTSMIVHDLRGPLSGIQGTLEFILADGSSKIDSMHQELLTEATRESERLMNLINEILDFSKIESGNFTISDDQVRIGGVLRTSVRSLVTVAQREGLHLLSGHPAELPQIQGSAEKLTQAVINLISNALKFTPRGGVIAVSAQLARVAGGADSIVITVTDTGVGIKAADQARLFAKYEQSSNQSLRGGSGTGLGLYIVRRIVEAHEGSVELASIAGLGTSMVIRLPIRRVQNQSPT